MEEKSEETAPVVTEAVSDEKIESCGPLSCAVCGGWVCAGDNYCQYCGHKLRE